MGVVGLGRGFSLMVPTFIRDERVKLVAANDPRPEAMAQFERDFDGKLYKSYDQLCEDDSLDLIYVASPHQFHEEHVIKAARAGKHVLVEKPMALRIDACTRMIEAAKKSGVQLIVGPCHSFDAPILTTRKIISDGVLGKPKMITAFNFTDFIYRPRRPEELKTAEGGGVVFSQGAHHIDILRLLAGGLAESVFSVTGNWDASRTTEGAYSAIIKFNGGTTATLTYNGYGYFDSDQFVDWIDEFGNPKKQGEYKSGKDALLELKTVKSEIAYKAERAYGGSKSFGKPKSGVDLDRQHEHFGTFIISCEKGDIRPMPNRVEIYTDTHKTIPLPPPTIPRAEVVDELYAAIFEKQPPIHSGEWGRATLEICQAILKSAETNKEIKLNYQVSC